MEKINVADILKKCPTGTKLDCTMYEDVYFDYVDELNIIHCYIQYETHKTSLTFNQYGTPNSNIKSKCVIFPTGKDNWDGFVQPVSIISKFKDGDIIIDSSVICIFKGEGMEKGTVDYYCGTHTTKQARYFNVKDHKKNPEEHYGYIDDYRLATEEEKVLLFKEIERNGYRWNEDTKTLEKLVTPRFKTGDRIRCKNGIDKYSGLEEGIITSIKDNTYGITIPYLVDIVTFINIADQDNWELVTLKFKVGDRIRHRIKRREEGVIKCVSFKFYTIFTTDEKTIFIPIADQDNWKLVDISTFVPFETKVLVRNTEEDIWKPAIFGCYANKTSHYYVLGGTCWSYCIPYEGNEHLRGKIEDCDKRYKTWKE